MSEQICKCGHKAGYHMIGMQPGCVVGNCVCTDYEAAAEQVKAAPPIPEDGVATMQCRINLLAEYCTAEVSAPLGIGPFEWWLIERVASLEARVREAEEAIYWADGQREDFRERGPKEGAYWWRKELMNKYRAASPPGRQR